MLLYYPPVTCFYLRSPWICFNGYDGYLMDLYGYYGYLTISCRAFLVRAKEPPLPPEENVQYGKYTSINDVEEVLYIQCAAKTHQEVCGNSFLDFLDPSMFFKDFHTSTKSLAWRITHITSKCTQCFACKLIGKQRQANSVNHNLPTSSTEGKICHSHKIYPPPSLPKYAAKYLINLD